MSSGTTAQDKSWKSKEQADEAQYVQQKEQEQLSALKAKLEAEKANTSDFEGGFGGQEELEDRYATTSGEH